MQQVLQSSESTAFYLWLLITFSAGIIMAQDSWYARNHPRLDTGNLTATFTKVLVIHALWFIISAAFVLFSWYFKPSPAWKLHIVVGIAACLWTLGVVVWSARDVERLQVTTWACDTAPSSQIATDEFLDSCSQVETRSVIRMGSDIYLWSLDDTHFWRWIVPGGGKETLRTHWRDDVSAIYLATTEQNAPLVAGSTESAPGGSWSAGFDPQEQTEFRIIFVRDDSASHTTGSRLATMLRTFHHAYPSPSAG